MSTARRSRGIPLVSVTRDAADVERLYGPGWGTATLVDLFDRHAEAAPGRLAYVDDQRRMSYREVGQASVRFASSLALRGFGRDDRVALCMQPSVTFPIARLALARIGCVAVIVNPAVGHRAIVHAIEAAGCDAAVVATGIADGAAVLADIARIAGIREVVVDGDEPGDALSFERLVEQGSRDLPEDARPHRPHEIDDIIFTSGTTGTPKGVLSCQARWLAACSPQVEAGRFRSADVGLVLAPVGGTLGYLKTMFLPLIAGCTTILTNQSDPDEILSLIRRERPSYVAAVPTHLVRLVDAIGDAEAPRLRLAFYGGASLSDDAGARLRRLTGCFLLTSIGSTEAGVPAGTRMGDPAEVQLHTVGRAYPGSEVEAREEGGRTLDPGETGVLVSRGPTMFDGYLDDPDATRAALDRGWVRHGDLGSVDDEGLIRLAGRQDDVINRGALKISPTVVERLIAGHPAVSEVAVVGVPDRELGQRSLAFVTASSSVTLDDVRAYLTSRGVPRWQQPDRLAVIEEMPLSPGGKIARQALVTHPAAG